MAGMLLSKAISEGAKTGFRVALFRGWARSEDESRRVCALEDQKRTRSVNRLPKNIRGRGPDGQAAARGKERILAEFAT